MKPYPDITLPVVGADYPNKGKSPSRRFAIELCRPGDPVELRPEPKNPYDEHAVAVFNEAGVQMGYIPANRAVWIAQLIRQGTEAVAIFQARSEHGAFVRIAFDGSTPDLPPDFSADEEPDWWPDELPPEE